MVAVIGDGSMSAGMAYEAMNNAAETTEPADRHPQRQRHVDRPAGGRDERLSGPAGLRRRLPVAAPARQGGRRAPSPSRCRKPPARPRNTPAAWSPAAPSSRSWASTTSARSTATTWTPWSTVLKNVRDIDRQAGAGPRRHPEGQGLRARPRAPPTSTTAVVKFDVVTGQQAKAAGRRAQLHQGVRPGADQAGRARRPRSWRSPPPCRRAPASTCSASASPTAPSTSASPSSTR